LYEKIKIQTSTLNKGEIQYRERLEDIRVLRLEIKRLRREKAILQTETQNVEGLRTEIFKLQREVLRERTRVKVLEGMCLSLLIVRGTRIADEHPSMEETIRL
jgi:FtsZ-binding cell division protein ZapB